MILLFVVGDMKSQKRVFTIGSEVDTTFDYKTISEAVAALDTLVKTYGSVEFQIYPGTYEEQFEIKSFETLNNSDSVVFTKAPENVGSVIIENGSEFDSLKKYLVKLNGCRRVTFKNITFRTTRSPDFYNQIILTGGASHNRFESCVFESKEEDDCAFQNHINGIVIHNQPSDDKEEFNVFIKNKIIGGCIGISLEGKTDEHEEGNKIIDNEFTKQSIKSAEVMHNYIGFFNKNTVRYEGNGTAVTLSVDSVYEIQGNKIYSGGNTGLSIDTFNAFQPKLINFKGLSVFNNTISCPNGTALEGNKINGFFLGHNTFLNNTEKYTMDIDSVKYMLSVFNLLVNKATHGVFKITSNAAVKGTLTEKELGSDFNGIYSRGDTIGSFNDTIYETIEKWRTNRHGPDANSSFGSIEFENDTLGLELICGTSPSMRIKIQNNNFIQSLQYYDFFKTKDINGKSRESSNFWKGQADISVKIDINGYITDSIGSDTLRKAVVKIFAKRANKEKLEKIGELNVSNGSYAMDSLPYRDNYWLKIIPDKDLYPNYIPSYHTKELRWDTGDKGPRLLSEFCNDTINYNIFPRKLKEILAGDYNISGQITETTTTTTTTETSETIGSYKMEGSDPIPGLDVILDRIPPSYNSTVAITQTDADGNYSFSNLPEDSYQISIDYEGLPIDTLYQVKLDENSDSITNLNYCVDTTSQIEGCSYQSLGNKNIEFSNLKIFPNPMGEILNISGVEGSFNVRIVDTRGRNILQVFNKNKTTLISTTNFESGIYFISIKTQNGEHIYKVLK
jgi:hypothetical protein